MCTLQAAHAIIESLDFLETLRDSIFVGMGEVTAWALKDAQKNV